MNKLSFVLLGLVIILFSLYLPIDTPSATAYHFKTTIDNFIPLITFFIVIYISYFLMLFFSLIYLISLKTPRYLNLTLLAIAIACIIAYIFYWFFQNYIDRPAIIAQSIFDSVYLWINSQVAPYNAFPSLHVAISTICFISFQKIKSHYTKPILIWVILIILSTVFTKQHYFLDVLGGLFLGYLSFHLAEKVLHKSAKMSV